MSITYLDVYHVHYMTKPRELHRNITEQQYKTLINLADANRQRVKEEIKLYEGDSKDFGPYFKTVHIARIYP